MKKRVVDYENLFVETGKFLVPDIYIDDEKERSAVSRRLTAKEKRKILEVYFNTFFETFFNNNKRSSPSFLIGDLYLCKEDDEVVFHWGSNAILPFNKSLSIDFKNVDSDLISNLLNNYSKNKDIDSLPDLNILKKKTK